MIPEFAISTQATEVAAKLNTNRDRPSPATRRRLHLPSTGIARTSRNGTPACNKQGVDVARPHALHLGTGYGASYDEDIMTCRGQNSMLERIMTIKGKLMSANRQTNQRPLIGTGGLEEIGVSPIPVRRQLGPHLVAISIHTIHRGDYKVYRQGTIP